MLRVAVVGSGIVGAAIAYNTCARGAAVTLIDKALPGSGATGASFAWIGDSGEWPGGMKALRSGALAAWHRLENDVPPVNVRWVGALLVAGQLPDDGRDAIVQRGLRRVEALDIARLEPNLKTAPASAVHAATRQNPPG